MTIPYPIQLSVSYLTGCAVGLFWDRPHIPHWISWVASALAAIWMCACIVLYARDQRVLAERAKASQASMNEMVTRFGRALELHR